MIYFLAPDDPKVQGGIHQIYIMVDVLNELGYPARVFHRTPGFRCGWFENNTPIVATTRLRLERGDILVVPEYSGARHRELCGDAVVVVLNQNHFYMFTGAEFDDAWPGAYPGWPNARAALVTSSAIEHCVKMASRDSLPVYPARVVVDASHFAPAPKRRVIAFMPRKRRPEAEAVVQLLHRTAAIDGWEIRPIERMTHADAARAMSDAAIFLSFSGREGFGLPPAEAMAAGCYVVGYTGDGGREFMRPDWCSPIADQDIVGFAAEVGVIAQRWDADPAEVRRVADAGREFIVRNYGIDGLRNDLRAAFEQLARPGSEALQPHPTVVTHWSPPPAAPRRDLRAATRRILGAAKRR